MVQVGSKVHASWQDFCFIHVSILGAWCPAGRVVEMSGRQFDVRAGDPKCGHYELTGSVEHDRFG